jgi:hypothetical protein
MKRDLEMVCDQARAPEVRHLYTFANEAGRNAHLTGEIAKALGARASELFALSPQVEKVEILANTPLKG